MDNTKEQAPNSIGAKIKYFLQTHESIKQLLLFTCFGIICGGSQLVVNYVLKYALETIESLSPKYPFNWFIFSHTSTADFIGFLLGSFTGQLLTFILNRKNTFKATNNVVISAIMYTILAISIILMQTWVGGVVSVACEKAYVNAHNGQSSTGIINALITFSGLIVGGILAYIISFLGNKYLVMRNWGNKKKN